MLERSEHSGIWEIGSGIYLFIASFLLGLPWLAGLLLWGSIIACIAILRIDPIRKVIAECLFKKAKSSVPKLSDTERTALNAGDTWIEQDVFRASIDWGKLSAIETSLSAEEQSFLDNETQTLCALIDEWQIHQDNDLPESVWQYMKEQGFFGLVIKKEFGGKGFSARAHSDIVMKISSRSGAAGVTVMVPNSLGPGELLEQFGTEEQKNYYLPRLAKGIEIPCFALTEPRAGSDATSIQSEAIVLRRKVKNKWVLGLEISLNKRWITLSPVATLIGLALNLHDPEGLLKGVGKEGITCVLLERDTANLEIGHRHLPIQQPFMNGSIRGKNIFVPITQIIGGQINAGRGWEMLIDCLSIGRAISLPALAVGAGAVSYLSSSAFSRIRRQFKLEIGQFEGIEEKLAEIAGLEYLMDATRLLTLAAVYQGKKPSVASAMAKYYNTEAARVVLNHAMDIHGGRAVVMGPRNYLASLYAAIPIFITVEGANIMSRNLLIFGQGSMACHPFIHGELEALITDDAKEFGRLIWQHIHYFMKNFASAVLASLTGGLFISVPEGPLNSYAKRLARLSKAFAWLADLSLILLGGSLKRKERLSARLADAMSYLYMGLAVYRLAAAHPESQDHHCHAVWALQYCCYQAQKAMIDLCRNYPNRILGGLLSYLLFPLGQSMHYPDDKLSHDLAQLMQKPNDYREMVKKNLYLSGDPEQPLDRVEYAFELITQNAELYKNVLAKYHGKHETLAQNLSENLKEGKLKPDELQKILAMDNACWQAILVDEFDLKPSSGKAPRSLIN